MAGTTVYEDLASQFIDADKELAKGLGLPVKPRRQMTPFLNYHLKKRKEEEPPPQPPLPAVTTPALGAIGQPAANLTPEELALAEILAGAGRFGAPTTAISPVSERVTALGGYPEENPNVTALKKLFGYGAGALGKVQQGFETFGATQLKGQTQLAAIEMLKAGISPERIAETEGKPIEEVLFQKYPPTPAEIEKYREQPWFVRTMLETWPFLLLPPTAQVTTRLRTAGGIVKPALGYALEATILPVTERVTGAVVGAALKYGVVIPAKYTGAKAFQTALDAGLDKWIATQGRLIPESRSALGNLLVRDRAWLIEKATNNYVTRLAEAKAAKTGTQRAVKTAVDDTIRDIETRLVPRGTQTGAMAFGGKRAPPPTGGELVPKVPAVPVFQATTGTPIKVKGYRSIGGEGQFETELTDAEQLKLGRKYLLGEGEYFGISRSGAAKYGKNVRSSDVEFQNPYVIDRATASMLRALDLDAIKRQGYDGIIIKQGRMGLYGEGLAQMIKFPAVSAKARPELAKGVAPAEIPSLAKIWDTTKIPVRRGLARAMGIEERVANKTWSFLTDAERVAFETQYKKGGFIGIPSTYPAKVAPAPEVTKTFEVTVTQGTIKPKGGVEAPFERTFTVQAKTAKAAVKSVRDTGITADKIDVREVTKPVAIPKEAAPEVTKLDQKITANRGNIRDWFRDPKNPANKELLTYREVVGKIVKSYKRDASFGAVPDLKIEKVNLAVDPSRPLGESRDVYQIELQGKKLREVPKEVYDYYQSLIVEQPLAIPEAEAVPEAVEKPIGQLSDEDYLLGRAGEGSLTAYSTTHLTEAQNKTLKRLTRQGKILKVEMPIYSGAGNRYQYILPTEAQPVVQPTPAVKQAVTVKVAEGEVPPKKLPVRRPPATITGETATQRVKAIQASAPESVDPADVKEAHIEMAAPDGPRTPKPPKETLSGKDEPSDIVRGIVDKATPGERPDQTLLRLHEAAIGNENRRVNILIREGNQKLKALDIGVWRRGNLIPKTENIPQLDELYNALHNPSKVASGEIAIPKGYEKIYQELRGLTDWEQAARLDFDPAMATVDDYFYRGWKPPEGAFADVQQGRPLVKTPAFKKPRVDATYQEMRDAGFEPLFWNPYQQWGISRMQGTKYREQMELVSSLKGMGDELIRPHTGGAIPQGWRVPEVGSAFEGKPFATTDPISNEPTVMFTRRWIVPDRVANTLENIYGKKPNLGKFIVAGKTIDPMAIIDWITFVPKRAKLFGSFFQQIDFLTRSGAGSWTRLVDAIAEGKPIKGLTALAKYPQSVGTILKANFSPTFRQTLAKQLDSTVPLIKDRPGINLKGISEAGLSTRDITIFPADMDKLVRQVATEAGVLGKGKRLAGAIGDLESAMRRGLFEGVYSAAITTDIKNNIAPMIARQYPELTDAQINGMIARVANIKYSTIPASQSVIQNRVLRETLRRVFFSTGESEGLLRQAAGSFHGPYASFWRKHWLGVYLFLIATANVIHFASTGKPLPKERYVPISKNEWGPLPIGYNTRFASPTLPFKGRGEAELTLDIVGQMDTAFRVLDPGFFIQARQGVPVRAMINQVSGKDFFGERIDDVGPGGVVSRTAQLVADLFSPIGGGGLASELARENIPGAKEIITKGETRIGLKGLGVQATGMNVRAAPKVEALDRAMTKLGLAGATEANLKQRQALYEAYFEIPSDVDEVKANRKEYPYTRAEYRERHPEVDAKLFILGYVSSLSNTARVIAVRLMIENKLTVDDIPGLKLGIYPSKAQKDRRSWFERALGTTPASTTPTPALIPTPAPTTIPVTATNTNLEKWNTVKARGGAQAIIAFFKLWNVGKQLSVDEERQLKGFFNLYSYGLTDYEAWKKQPTAAEEDLLKALFEQYPFGQTNYEVWKKQTMRQIYENSVFGK